MGEQITELGNQIKEAKTAGQSKEVWDPLLKEMLRLKVHMHEQMSSTIMIIKYPFYPLSFFGPNDVLIPPLCRRNLKRNSGKTLARTPKRIPCQRGRIPPHPPPPMNLPIRTRKNVLPRQPPRLKRRPKRQPNEPNGNNEKRRQPLARRGWDKKTLAMLPWYSRRK